MATGFILVSCSAGPPISLTDPGTGAPAEDDNRPKVDTTGAEAPPPPPPVTACGVFGNWQASDYLLPYPAGTSYVVNQANCSGFGHSGFWKNGYDFIMNIGTVVTASRGGTVGWANDGCSDGRRDCTNLITIIHSDSTVALYSHLTRGGVLVTPGSIVVAGDTIGLSGDTGNTGGLPHLHFSLHPCNELPGLPNAGSCPTRPVNFRNTKANPNGLIARESYLAE